MLFDETLIELFDTDDTLLGSLKWFVMKGIDIFSTLSIHAKEHYLRYAEGKHQTFSEFYNFELVRKNNDFAEFKVHLIHDIGNRSLTIVSSYFLLLYHPISFVFSILNIHSYCCYLLLYTHIILSVYYLLIYLLIYLFIYLFFIYLFLFLFI